MSSKLCSLAFKNMPMIKADDYELVITIEYTKSFVSDTFIVRFYQVSVAGCLMPDAA
jgi:hypothetical protein